MNNYDKFIGKLYDILIRSNIISYNDKPKDLKEKKKRLETYLEKLNRVQTKAIDKEHQIREIKRLYYDNYIIKGYNIPDSYFKYLEKRYLDEGHGHYNLVNPTNKEEKKLKTEHINSIIREQKDSLDTWLDYFLSHDSDYLPMWAKVWAFQGMLNIGNLNKDKDGYSRRSNTSVNPFVSLDSEILGKCVELISDTFNNNEITDKEVEKLVDSGSFSKLYGKLLSNKKQLKIESNDGIWIKYNYESEEQANKKEQNGDIPEYLKLYNSLQGYNTGWCTAGSRKTAKRQICGASSYQGGDFYVYYTKDKNGEYKIPRIAIRMNKGLIGEIRGVASNQNIEPNMEKVLEEKLKEFSDANSYKKKVSDMKKLTEIYESHEIRKLTKEELIFLYEVEDKIQGFGYDIDPRIEEIKQKRNKKRDFAIIYNCKEEEIGLTRDDLFKNNLVYYFGNISYLDFKKMQDLGLKLPENVIGDLDLRKLTTARGLILPKTVVGRLYLWNLTTTEGLELPKIVYELDLNSLKTAEGLVLPEKIDYLYLNSLTMAKGLKFPKEVKILKLSNLKTSKGLVLPEIVGSLDLSGLTSAEELYLPKQVKELKLNNLEMIENVVFPNSINFIDLSSLTTAKNVVFPSYVETIDLSSLTKAQNVTLPQKVGYYLNLSGLTTVEGLVFPKKVDTLNLSGLTTAEGLVLPEECRYLELGNLTNPKKHQRKRYRVIVKEIK